MLGEKRARGNIWVSRRRLDRGGGERWREKQMGGRKLVAQTPAGKKPRVLGKYLRERGASGQSGTVGVRRTKGKGARQGSSNT